MKASWGTLHYAWVVLGALVAAPLACLAVPMALAIREAPVRPTPRPTPARAGLPAPAG